MMMMIIHGKLILFTDLFLCAARVASKGVISVSGEPIKSSNAVPLHNRYACHQTHCGSVVLGSVVLFIVSVYVKSRSFL